MRTDGRTDGQPEITKLIVAFGNFANGPKRFRVADGNGTYTLCPVCSFVRLTFYKPLIQTQFEHDPHLQELVNEVTDSQET